MKMTARHFLLSPVLRTPFSGHMPGVSLSSCGCGLDSRPAPSWRKHEAEEAVAFAAAPPHWRMLYFGSVCFCTAAQYGIIGALLRAQGEAGV